MFQPIPVFGACPLRAHEGAHEARHHQAWSVTAELLITDLVDELARHAPFDAMTRTVLADLARRLTLHYFAKGSVVLSPDSGVVTDLFIVQRGEVAGGYARADPRADAEMHFSAGECFPFGALLAARPAFRTLIAITDTFCYKLPAKDFAWIMETSPPFRAFATQRLGVLLAQSQRNAQTHYATSVGDNLRLASPVKSLIRRRLVAVTGATPIIEAVTLMQRKRIGSVVIIDGDGRPVGIFTERDVLNRIVLGGVALDRPIAEVMTPHPFTLPAHAPLIDAAQAMARHRFRHVLVMEEGKLVGVVSERDLFTVQLRSLAETVTMIDTAASATALAVAAREVRALCGSLFAQGVAAESLMQFVTTLNDAIVARALVLAAITAPPPHPHWCWIALGSEGRMEQTLSTDQDNGLIFSADDAAAAAAQQPAFLAFAGAANRILDQCGFPLCKGEIMAMNPRWCQSASAWQAIFESWMRRPEPDALLHAAIFFDFRGLAGEIALADTLRQWLSARVMSYPLFIRQLTANALAVRPPLGILRDFVTVDPEHPGTIDLKKYGVRPLIDGARVLALRAGVTAANTAERLRLAGAKLQLDSAELGAAVDSFHFLQWLRLRHQTAMQQPMPEWPESPVVKQPHAAIGATTTLPPHANSIDPDALNPLDRRILKEAFTQARNLQRRIEMDFLS